MSYQFVFYPDPPTAPLAVKPDAGGQYSSVPYTHTDGRQGQVATIPDTVPDQQGCLLEINESGYQPWSARGFLMLFKNATTPYARFQIDDAKLIPIQSAPPPDQTDPNLNPLQVIQHVYNSTNAKLGTPQGCGLFTEDCAKELHDKMHAGWGHIKKNPGQNQFNGHAVDAIMLLVASGGTAPGIYDIIQSSASPEAKPVFNYVEPPNNELWYYPPAPISGDPQSVTTYAAPKKGKK